MNRPSVIRVLLAVLAVSAEPVGGQATPAAALSLPLNGALVCQAIPDPQGTILEFTDSVQSFTKRETTLSYDTLGNPLQLVVLALGNPVQGRAVGQLVVVRFSPKAEGATTSVNGYDPNLVLPLLSAEDSIDNLPPGWKEATATEVQRARCLALDFWKRRCGKDVPRPTPAGPPTTE